MEEKNQVIHIPINEYEKDLNTKFSKDKKKEIRELLTNHNQLHSQNELNEISELLHEACKKGDIELIIIYLNETIESEANDLTFKINKINKTALLFKINNKQIKDFIVPRTVIHEYQHLFDW